MKLKLKKINIDLDCDNADECMFDSEVCLNTKDGDEVPCEKCKHYGYQNKLIKVTVNYIGFAQNLLMEEIEKCFIADPNIIDLNIAGHLEGSYVGKVDEKGFCKYEFSYGIDCIKDGMRVPKKHTININTRLKHN